MISVWAISSLISVISLGLLFYALSRMEKGKLKAKDPRFILPLAIFFISASITFIIYVQSFIQ